MELRVDRVVRVSAGEDAGAWRRALEDGGWVGGAVVMKEDGGSWVRRARVMGREVVVKCRELGTWWKRVKFGVGTGHGAKQWRGAERLMRAGIATGRPLVVARALVDGRVCEVMVLEFVEGKTLLEVLDEIVREPNRGVRWQHQLARVVGASVSQMMAKGCFNRDHKPSNLIVVGGPGTEPTIAVIDAVGIFAVDADRDEALRRDMLAALYIEPSGVGCVPRRTLWLRTILAAGADRPSYPLNSARSLLRARVKWVRRAVRRHGDARPRVDPLRRG